jgi:hypothetical protein
MSLIKPSPGDRGLVITEYQKTLLSFVLGFIFLHHPTEGMDAEVDKKEK